MPRAVSLSLPIARVYRELAEKLRSDPSYAHEAAAAIDRLCDLYEKQAALLERYQKRIVRDRNDLLYGWTCEECGSFNGTPKDRKRCCGCDKPRR